MWRWQVDDSFKLKLLFDRFSVAAAALDSSLPQNSRLSVIEAFNKVSMPLCAFVHACVDGCVCDDR